MASSSSSGVDRKPRKVQRFPYPWEGEVGPFLGCRDQYDPTGEDLEHYARNMRNCYIPEPGGAVIGRPGFGRLNTGLVGLLAGTYVIGLAQYTKKDGSANYPIAFVSGKMFRLDTGADITPTLGSIVIDNRSTGCVHAVMFNDELIVSDGVNAPWRYNGTTTGTRISFDATTFEASYGKPTVYYAKLFFIRNSNRAQILWSEELDASKGYVQIGTGPGGTNYTDSWTLAVTDQNPLVALQGTNQALYFFRNRSIGSIQGSVTTDFVTAGTLDGVSTEIGCTGSASVLEQDNTIYFLDRFGRPYVIEPGAGISPLWHDCRETLNSAQDISGVAGGLSRVTTGQESAATSPPAWGCYDAERDLLMWMAGLDSGTGDRLIMVFRAGDRKYMGVWKFSDGVQATHNFTCLKSIVISGNAQVAFGTSLGNVFVFSKGDSLSASYQDVVGGSTFNVEHIIDTHPLGFEDAGELVVDTVLETIRAEDGAARTALILQYETNRTTLASSYLGPTSSPAVPSGENAQVVFGLRSCRGRQVRLRFQHNDSLNAFTDAKRFLWVNGVVTGSVHYPDNAIP